jgi:hypothetical protein
MINPRSETVGATEVIGALTVNPYLIGSFTLVAFLVFAGSGNISLFPLVALVALVAGWSSAWSP